MTPVGPRKLSHSLKQQRLPQTSSETDLISCSGMLKHTRPSWQEASIREILTDGDNFSEYRKGPVLCSAKVIAPINPSTPAFLYCKYTVSSTQMHKTSCDMYTNIIGESSPNEFTVQKRFQETLMIPRNIEYSQGRSENSLNFGIQPWYPKWSITSKRSWHSSRSLKKSLV